MNSGSRSSSKALVRVKKSGQFGDNVRIRSTPLTEELGLTGLCGVVYGFTNPSFTDVSVIGSSDKNFSYSSAPSNA
jgi:hypothetical protein